MERMVPMSDDSLLSSIPGSTIPMAKVCADVIRERVRQVAKWGNDSANDHPDGTGREHDRLRAAEAQAFTDWLAQVPGRVTWRAILAEEVAEAFAETDPEKLRAELVQVAAVAVKWVEAIDRRAES